VTGCVSLCTFINMTKFPWKLSSIRHGAWFPLPRATPLPPPPGTGRRLCNYLFGADLTLRSRPMQSRPLYDPPALTKTKLRDFGPRANYTDRYRSTRIISAKSLCF
jgi:hypothetical protein